MKRFLLVPLLLAAGIAADAQIYGGGAWGRNDRYGRRDNPYYGRDDRYGGYRGSSVVDRAISDLQRVRTNRLENHDRKHVEKAISELNKFQDKYYRQGKFDTGHLDKAIDNMRDVAQADRSARADSRRLYATIDELRAFRASRGQYERGGYSGGYRNDRYNRW